MIVLPWLQQIWLCSLFLLPAISDITSFSFFQKSPFFGVLRPMYPICSGEKWHLLDCGCTCFPLILWFVLRWLEAKNNFVGVNIFYIRCTYIKDICQNYPFFEREVWSKSIGPRVIHFLTQLRVWGWFFFFELISYKNRRKDGQYHLNLYVMPKKNYIIIIFSFKFNSRANFAYHCLLFSLIGHLLDNFRYMQEF